MLGQEFLGLEFGAFSLDCTALADKSSQQFRQFITTIRIIIFLVFNHYEENASFFIGTIICFQSISRILRK